ncbi:MAG: hypothetical protein M1817_006390 [Caeruleum heppii]|nr:MAG: hypothetical protein M1817_006390 [Caeruleum heppii]
MDLQGDPFDWSVDQVVEALCRRHAVWSTSNGGPDLPRPYVLEQSLRKNAINGVCLLTQVDRKSLKKNLKITTLGHQASLMLAVRTFQARSTKWHQDASLSRRLSLSGHQDPLSPQSLMNLRLQRETVSPWASPFGQPSRYVSAEENAYMHTPGPPPPDQLLQSSGHSDHANSVSNEHVPLMVNQAAGGGSLRPSHGPLLHTPVNRGRAPSTEPTTVSTQHGERISPVSEPSRLEDPISAQMRSDVRGDDGNGPSAGIPEPLGPLAQLPPRKRIAPTFMHAFDVESPTKKQRRKGRDQESTVDGEDAEPAGNPNDVQQIASHEHHRGYLGPRAMPIHEFLPGSAAAAENRGQVNVGPQMSSSSPDEGDDTDDFVITATETMMTGQKLYVHRLVQNALFNFDPEVTPAIEGDDLLPTFGESGSEGDYDSETYREMENEERERAAAKKGVLPLTDEEVVQAITLSIDDLAKKWREKKLLKRELRAWAVWSASRRTGMMRIDIAEAKRLIVYINNERLPRIAKEITRDTWTNTSQVRKQCASMEQSVFDREDLAWKISVLEQKSEPARPPPRLRNVHDKDSSKALAATDSSDDSIGSDVSMKEPDDFIVDDGLPAQAGMDDSDDPTRLPDDELAPTHLQTDDDALPDLEMSDGAEQDDDLEDDIVPPSTRRSKRYAVVPSSSPDTHPLSSVGSGESSRTLRLPTPSAPATPHHDVPPSVIDLTYSSDAQDEADAGFDVRTPPLNDVDSDNPFQAVPSPCDRMSKGIKKEDSRRWHKSSRSASTESETLRQRQDNMDTHQSASEAEFEDIDKIVSYRSSVLEEQGDQKRLLMKVLHNYDQDTLAFLSHYLSGTSQDKVRQNVWQALKAMREDRTTIPGIDDTAFLPLMTFAILYICWYECKKPRNSEGIPRYVINRALGQADLFAPYCTFMHQALRRYDDDSDEMHEPLMIEAATAEVKETTEEAVFEKKSRLELSNALLNGQRERESDRLPSPNKIRKRAIVENVKAKNVRENDRQRVLDQDRRRKQLMRSLERMGPAATGGITRIPINTDVHNLIYLNDHVAKQIKPHQIEGVQFMWREVVTDKKSLQGCLLAHTMGLGKTMQVITLLVTIAEAAKSPQLSPQIPPSLRQSRTLILCPPSLLDNWWDEILMWAPIPVENNVGQLRKVDSLLFGMNDRLLEISGWYEEGGILLISYDMFRLMIRNKPTKTRPQPLDEDQHEQARSMLLEGPNIIVADEAHKLRNGRSGISAAASQFKSKSRIALTGSPLANNLEEYYSMIDWVAPGYLGPLVEFRAHYVEPIQDGLWMNSTKTVRRVSLKKLHALKEELNPKVTRADITVLKGSLPPKTEFLIKVPLTALQARSYRIYVDAMLSKDDKVANARLWDWLAVLSLLCNHPVCFRDKMIERDEQNKSKGKGSGVSNNLDEENLDVPGDASAAKLEIGPDHIQQQMALFAALDQPLDRKEHSHKAQLFDQILDAAIEAGDKTLVFSHSLLTLDYLESLLKQSGRRYTRMDGKTKMSDRQQATKAFNAGNLDVYLISTRAGGLGLNLPGANRVIIVDFAFNPTWEEQAIGRVFRIGQTKPVFVYRFITGGTFEDVIRNKAVFKMQLATRVVDKKNPMRHAQSNIRDYLFHPKDVERHDLTEFAGTDPTVLDVVLAHPAGAGIVHSIELTETFARDEDDDLTPEERREVEQLLKDRQLQRSDPAAYEAMMLKRQAVLLAQPNGLPPVGLFPGAGAGSKGSETPVYPPGFVPTAPSPNVSPNSRKEASQLVRDSQTKRSNIEANGALMLERQQALMAQSSPVRRENGIHSMRQAKSTSTPTAVQGGHDAPVHPLGHDPPATLSSFKLNLARDSHMKSQAAPELRHPGRGPNTMGHSTPDVQETPGNSGTNKLSSSQAPQGPSTTAQSATMSNTSSGAAQSHPLSTDADMEGAPPHAQLHQRPPLTVPDVTRSKNNTLESDITAVIESEIEKVIADGRYRLPSLTSSGKRASELAADMMLPIRIADGRTSAFEGGDVIVKGLKDYLLKNPLISLAMIEGRVSAQEVAQKAEAERRASAMAPVAAPEDQRSNSHFENFSSDPYDAETTFEALIAVAAASGSYKIPGGETISSIAARQATGLKEAASNFQGIQNGSIGMALLYRIKTALTYLKDNSAVRNQLLNDFLGADTVMRAALGGPKESDPPYTKPSDTTPLKAKPSNSRPTSPSASPSIFKTPRSVPTTSQSARSVPAVGKATLFAPKAQSEADAMSAASPLASRAPSPSSLPGDLTPRTRRPYSNNRATDGAADVRKESSSLSRRPKTRSKR